MLDQAFGRLILPLEFSGKTVEFQTRFGLCVKLETILRLPGKPGVMSRAKLIFPSRRTELSFA